MVQYIVHKMDKTSERRYKSHIPLKTPIGLRLGPYTAPYRAPQAPFTYFLLVWLISNLINHPQWLISSPVDHARPCSH